MNLQRLKEVTAASNVQTLKQRNRIMNNQRNMTPPQETNKALITDLKEMAIYELNDKEFRKILLKEFSEL